MPRPEPRFRVDFPTYLNWQGKNGIVRRVRARCVDLSASGARVETAEALELRSMVLMTSDQFGRMGNATVRYCRREGLKYIVGLEFCTVFGLGDPLRKAALNKVMLKTPPTGGDAVLSGEEPVDDQEQQPT